MRLLTFETPIETNALLFTSKAEPVSSLHTIFPFLKGCKIKLDLQVDVSGDEIIPDVLYIPLSEASEGMTGSTTPLLSELQAIGESLERQKELELKTEKLMNEIYSKAEQTVPEPLPIEEQ